MHWRPSPVFETADPPGGGDRNSFSADYVARLQADLDKVREDLRAAEAKHTTEVNDLKRTHGEAMATLRREHEAAVAATAQQQAEALDAAKNEGKAALTAAETAHRQRVVDFALRAEAAGAGLLDMDALKLLDQAEVDKLTMDDAGAVAGAKPLIEAMKKAKPFLFGQGSTSNPNPTPPNNTPPALKNARDMTDAEFAEANARRAWRGAIPRAA